MTFLRTHLHRNFARRSSRHPSSTPAQSQRQSAVPRIAATRATTNSQNQCPLTDGYRAQAYRIRPAPFAANQSLVTSEPRSILSGASAKTRRAGPSGPAPGVKLLQLFNSVSCIQAACLGARLVCAHSLSMSHLHASSLAYISGVPTSAASSRRWPLGSKK